MALILKTLGLLTSLATTVYLTVKVVQSGLLIVPTVVGVIKIIVALAFCSLLVYIFYLLLNSKKAPFDDKG